MTQTIALRDFKTEHRLGSGSFAQVFEGFWNKQKVAIKKFIPKQNTTAEKYQKSFDNEIKLHGQCLSPHIVALLAICIENSNDLYAIQEHMEGGDLRHMLLNNHATRLSSYTLWTIISDVVSALNYIHAKQIVHNDIKPENILLTRDNRGKITDFGISTLSGASSVGGTVQYLAPECYQKPHTRKASTDIYALGMVIWEIWCGNGKLPFSNFVQAYKEKHQSTSNQTQLNQLASTAMRRYIALGGKEVIPEDISQGTAKIISNCWQKAEERPSASMLFWSVFSVRRHHTKDPALTTTTTEIITEDGAYSEEQQQSALGNKCVDFRLS